MTSPPQTPERTPLTRVRRMISLIPTPWLITGAGGVLLAGTAVFGGLAPVPALPTPELVVGETFTGSDLEVTVIGAEWRTERGALAVFPDESERILVLTAEVTNTFAKPRLAETLSIPSPVLDGIAVAGLDAEPVLSRTDGSAVGALQPDLPVRVLLAWVVAPDALADTTEVQLTLPDSTHHLGTNVLRGQDFWSEVTVGATMTVPVAGGGA